MIANLKIPRSKTSPIGVDIGQRGIRMAQLTHTRGTYAVSAIARLDYRTPASGPDEMSERLRSCFNQGDFHGKNSVFSLAAPEVAYFALELPPVSPTEQASIAKFEVERLVAERAQAVEIRHWPVPPGRPNAPSALGLAAPRTAIDGLVHAVQRTPLSCVRLDAAETALCRLSSVLIADRAIGVWGVLDCGQLLVRLILCVDDVPVLVRVVGPGGGTLTDRLAETLQTTPATAEVHKIDHGIAESSKAGDDSGAEIGAMHFSILRTELQAIAAEIKRSYEYVLSCYPGRKALDLVLTGGGARLKNLDSFLAGMLGINVRGASSYLSAPGCRLHFASGKSLPLESMAHAIGLAIGD